MDVTRALEDLDEVRSRLAAVQRFRGLSAAAALASAVGAAAAGAAQSILAPRPEGAREVGLYVTIWIACLAFALAVNYGAILVWALRHWSRRSQSELRTVGMTILPAIVAGGAFTAAVIARGEYGLLPGVWCTCYALGLLASRAMAPRGVTPVALGFGAAGAALLFAHGDGALAWWVMPLTFGTGQAIVAGLIARDAEASRGAIA